MIDKGTKTKDKFMTMFRQQKLVISAYELHLYKVSSTFEMQFLNQSQKKVH
jgi:hypothetical protein